MMVYYEDDLHGTAVSLTSDIQEYIFTKPVISIGSTGTDGYTVEIYGEFDYKPIPAGLPNIEGKFGEFMYSGTENVSGPFTYTANSTAKMGGTTAKNKGYITMNLQSQNSIFGASDTVTPKSCGTCYIIKY